MQKSFCSSTNGAMHLWFSWKVNCSEGKGTGGIILKMIMSLQWLHESVMAGIQTYDLLIN